jgi:methyl-accepting chemotaxis protein
LPAAALADEIGGMARALGVKTADALTNEKAAAQAASAAHVTSLDGLSRAFETRVGQMVADLSASATEMKTQAGSMTDAAGRTVQQATNVAAAEQASVNVQTVASAAEELASSINEIAHQVAQSAKIAGKAKDDAAQTDGVVRAGVWLVQNLI